MVPWQVLVVPIYDFSCSKIIEKKFKVANNNVCQPIIRTVVIAKTRKNNDDDDDGNGDIMKKKTQSNIQTIQTSILDTNSNSDEVNEQKKNQNYFHLIKLFKV